ncbi:hypothetical protein F1654_02005 [Alkalicaulis satelles]|uniref:Uncharacterized protein n=1 Tax=Alkalicaulis satelles TaxID=2609175 RepID=A0A5M6ZM83_9PROT|nr:hypothetical protein [Alkalicaulis satelles]KAA5804797.1 hypothetical protein F1654_02005 [Alkalicaulis satelles]
MEQDSRFIELAFRMWREIKEKDGADTPRYLLSAVSSVPSADWDDLVLKLALWRWVHEGLERPASRPDQMDQLVYSIYRDALKLAGREDYAKPVDNETEFFSEMLSDSRAA